MPSFSAQVGAWAKGQKDAAEAIFHDAAQAVVNDMQTTVGEGGNMPVDTGFLRASLLASSDSMPQIREGATPDRKATYSYSSGPISLVINEVPVGGKVFVGYTAAYANVANYGGENRQGRLFVEQAAQKWPTFVAQAEAKASQAFK